MSSFFQAVDVVAYSAQDLVETAAFSLHSFFQPSRHTSSPSPSPSSSASSRSSTSSSTYSNFSTSTPPSRSPLLSNLPLIPSTVPTAQSSIADAISPTSSSSGTDSRLGNLWGLLQTEEKRELRFRGMTKEEIDQLLWDHRTVFTAGTASLVSTAASFPFDSLKSRLQVKYYPSIWDCAKAVFREEGMGGFFRGVFIPLITISFVRTSSFSIYVKTKEALHARDKLNDKSKLSNTALSGMAGGATSGVIISCGSAPFELVKVQRQLEYLTAVQQGLIGSNNRLQQNKDFGAMRPAQTKFQGRSGFVAAADIFKNHGGIKGFYIGFPLHLTRDTFGTAFYFGSYDSIRSIVNKHTNPKNGSLYGIPGPVVSFLSGSTAGIASWLIVYPVDLLKTNVQQRTLSHHPQQLTGYQLFTHLLRERPPPEHAVRSDTFLKRFLRLYRGLGVSALRSFISHGLTWSIIEALSDRIEKRTGKEVRSTR